MAVESLEGSRTRRYYSSNHINRAVPAIDLDVFGKLAHYRPVSLGDDAKFWELKLKHAGECMPYMCRDRELVNLYDYHGYLGFNIISEFDETQYLSQDTPYEPHMTQIVIANIRPSLYPNLHAALMALPIGEKLALHGVTFFFWGQPNGLHSAEGQHPALWITVSPSSWAKGACQAHAATGA